MRHDCFRNRNLFHFWAAILLFAGTAIPCSASYVPSTVTPPKPMQEIRATWVASVGNIDWPSRKGLTTAEQKAELIAILNRAVQLKLNTIIFQVRPGCDALYASRIEPWSEYLTGTMGQAPSPKYDPLAFAIDEAHQRGLELHAWFNPYRARHSNAKSPISPGHVSKTHPNLVRQYGNYLWLDPGEPETQAYSLSVVMDVVERYDVDGIHFDDYFYPYKETDSSGHELDFPDRPSWQKYGAGGQLSRDDWRRENVNSFIHATYNAIKARKPWVKFGISPFGIWRPGNPQQIHGFDPYAKLYADSRKWLMNGWVDYFAPQLYWAINPPDQSFPVLLRWWVNQNPLRRHLAPGLDATKVGGKWEPKEILNQVSLTRQQPGASGDVFWDVKSLMRSDALETALGHGLYAESALPPSYPWLETRRPPQPKLSVRTASSPHASWSTEEPIRIWLWLVQFRKDGEWTTEILPAHKTSRTWSGSAPDVIAVSSVDRFGNISPAAVLERKKDADASAASSDPARTSKSTTWGLRPGKRN
jgi:uncharacterized lipoprotein YddW (UPF0748 family)